MHRRGNGTSRPVVTQQADGAEAVGFERGDRPAIAREPTADPCRHVIRGG